MDILLVPRDPTLNYCMKNRGKGFLSSLFLSSGVFCLRHRGRCPQMVLPLSDWAQSGEDGRRQPRLSTCRQDSASAEERPRDEYNVHTGNHAVHTVDFHPDPDRKVEFTPSAQEAKEALDEIEKILSALKHRSPISSKVSDLSEACSESL